ncbi:FMN-binding protein [Pectinatus haikarae]|uniref:Major membrane immunogen (Membrane-anchored lipoprotein) n=1 Tax=Pectinatus haikarae TaxID=349096 RepID=A0ABT9Y855_9FIRM|nr:FMN-binding protein [Pectinatus haikarae]MDQ0204018.1 major membrane immunogen (membrane-anchored lipoprotein) [Pectinatus haikarae]
MKKKYGALVFAGVLSTQILAGCAGEQQTENAANAVAVPVPASSGENGKAPCCDLSDTKDGEYAAESKADSFMGHGRIALTIKDHKITAVNFVGVDPEGNIKGADYGKTNGQVENPGFYQKAQRAVKANSQYAEQLLQVQELAKVDVISGATASYDQFVESAKIALENSKK